MNFQSIVSLWFTSRARVSPREYVLSALFLGVVKYAVDVAIIYGFTRQWWTPWSYVRPFHWSGELSNAPTAAYLCLALWSLPFLWVGMSLSIRRALDAGISPWSALWFFVPLANYVLLFRLSTASRAPEPRTPSRFTESTALHGTSLRRTMQAIGLAVGIGAIMVLVCVPLLETYGSALFLATPFVMGAVSGYWYNRPPATLQATMQMQCIAMLFVAAVLLLVAAEGALCLLMAAPIALAIGMMGAASGRALALERQSVAPPSLTGFLLLPLAATFEAKVLPLTDGPTLHEVRSEVVIDAPVDVVWQNVVEFPPLPAPAEWMFRAGVAYPERATIKGAGVGAVRYCEFSTGPFVEPITRWEPNRRLSFNVDSQPRPLTELSPYAGITPPHLDGYLVSRRGEFRLVPLSPTRTRLEGSTWYQMHLEPASYWTMFGDAIIHRIHLRVLSHIKRTSERVVARVN